jgi:hypothetical protein
MSVKVKVLKISSIGIVSARIEISVGVSEARIAVDGAGVSVAGEATGATLDGDEAGAGKAWTEKLQDASRSELTISTIIRSDHLRSFKGFSLSGAVG